jgi:hypothetical protein
MWAPTGRFSFRSSGATNGQTTNKMFDEPEKKTTGDMGPYRAFFVPF